MADGFYNEGREEGADRNERVSNPFSQDVKRFSGRYDVIVIGGGVSGCAAALSARRCGCSVLLVEKMTMLGGLATAGYITLYLPLCDGYGRKVVSGIAEEFLHLSTKYSYGTDTSHWQEEKKRYESVFNAPAFALALEERLLEEGVEIIYDTLFVGSRREGSRVTGVYVENTDGKSMIESEVVIDASGSAEVFSRLGSKCFSRENSLSEWSYAARGGEGHIMLRGSSLENGIRLIALGTVDKSARTHVVEEPYYADTATSVDRFIKDGHSRILDLMKRDESLVMASLPSMPQFRMSRRIDGEYTLGEKDASAHFEDNIGGVGDWRRPGPCYEIPYRCLYTSEWENLLSCGRCISSADIAWEITRVIPPSVLTGEAAGIAAYLAIEGRIPVSEVDAAKLRMLLEERGNILDINL